MARSTTPPGISNSVVFEVGPYWEQSLISSVKDSPQIVQKIKDFRELKSKNPMAPFGSNDRPFIGAGIFKQYLPKALKAHLTPDISIIYELSGRNPTTIKLHGVFTHADMGTGQPANIKIQKNLAKRLAKEEIELDQ
jgi:hypothetical protein